jgi:pectin methylesterase-like acyl-CoA thioesterase
MKKTAAALVTLLIVTVAAGVLPAKAETRTIIVPDDYPTIQSAIDAASTGDTVFVRKGTYKELTLRINKALSLIGEDAVTTRITLNPPWIEYENPVPFDWSQISHYDDAVKIEANNVKLSGFTIICNVSKIGGGCFATG